MDKTEIQTHLNLKQTELNFTHEPEKRASIQNDMSVLRLKLEIETIKEKIEQLNKR